MIASNERLVVVETKVEILDEKVEELKKTVKDNHEKIKGHLMDMSEKNNAHHIELSNKIGNLENLKNRLTWMITGAIVLFGILGGQFEKVVAYFK